MIDLHLVKKIVLVLACGLAIGCSGQNASGPLLPADLSVSGSDNNLGTRNCWGLWEFRGSLASESLEIIPLREAIIHLNALYFLEPPAYANLWIDGPIKVDGDVIEATIALKHPLYGYTEYTGFDVKGVLITNGQLRGYLSAPVNRAGKDEIRLLNADGYTRWWAPVYFKDYSSLLVRNYIDGLLGTPDSEGQFAASINPYKYFCDDLGPLDDVPDMNLENRGMFGCTSTNKRHYVIKVPTTEFVFNYAVDASWAEPASIPPFDVPGDFPMHANQPEAYYIDVEEVSNTLYYDGEYGGGGLSLDITVYQWRPFDTTRRVFFEAPEVIGPHDSLTPVEEGPGWAKYNVHTTFVAPQSNEPLELLIGAESSIEVYDFGSEYIWLSLATFTTYEAQVGSAAPGGTPGTLKGIKVNPIQENTLPYEYPWRYSQRWRDGHFVICDQDIMGYLETLDGGKTWQEYPDTLVADGILLSNYKSFIGFDHRIYFFFHNRWLAIETTPGSHEFTISDLKDDPDFTPPDGSMWYILVDPDGNIYLFYWYNSPYLQYINLVFSTDEEHFQGPFLIYEWDEKVNFYTDMGADGTVFVMIRKGFDELDAIMLRGNLNEGISEPTIIPSEYLNEDGTMYVAADSSEGFTLSDDLERVVIYYSGRDGFPETDDAGFKLDCSYSYDWGESFTKWFTNSRANDYRSHGYTRMFARDVSFLPGDGQMILTSGWEFGWPWGYSPYNLPFEYCFVLSYTPDGSDWTHTLFDWDWMVETRFTGHIWSGGFCLIDEHYIGTLEFVWY